ncbi:hypothetical protein [Litoreibacter albidus]|uniref:YdhG-like domain-containing protein n=1 Tax=Litoreibacter albidus TaxID=670155 RepID=A0A1H2RR78_9RHOB|nr:hypothetical protein [Litoreibacter albidus]SDW21911.1 hypothetical protein SAMN04488001_0587 [Litoreibacter albidus]
MLASNDIPDAIFQVFASMPADVATTLRAARLDILRAAAASNEVGQLDETMKWGEPAYLTCAPKTGTTLRLGLIGGQAAVMVPCSTAIIDDARAIFGPLPELSGKRGLVLGGQRQVFNYVVDAALHYHLRKRVK